MESVFKHKRDSKEGRLSPSEASCCSADIPRWSALSIGTSQKIPLLHPDPLACWCGPENIVWVGIDNESSWALLDNGSMISAVSPKFVEAHSLDVCPLSNLVNSTVRVNSFSGLFSRPLSCIVIRVQVEGVWGYEEDQVALVTPDPIDFGSWVPVTLGTLTVSQIVYVIRGSKMDELSVSLSRSRVSYLLACWWAELSNENKVTANQTMDPTDMNKIVKTIRSEEVVPPSLKIMHAWTGTKFLGSNMHVMAQTLEEGDGPCLPCNSSIMGICARMAVGAGELQSWWGVWLLLQSLLLGGSRLFEL